MAQLKKDMSCEECVRKSKIDKELTRPLLQNISEHITAHEDAIQIDLIRELLPSSGCENIVTAMNVFFRNMFFYSTTSQNAKTFAIVLIRINSKLTYSADDDHFRQRIGFLNTSGQRSS